MYLLFQHPTSLHPSSIRHRTPLPLPIVSKKSPLFWFLLQSALVHLILFSTFSIEGDADFDPLEQTVDVFNTTEIQPQGAPFA